MLARLRELLEWGTNISFFFTDFFFIRGTDFAEKEGLLVASRCYHRLREMKSCSFVLNVHTGLNSLSSLNSNIIEQKPILEKEFLIKTPTERQILAV